jgi:hypothetical protein
MGVGLAVAVVYAVVLVGCGRGQSATSMAASTTNTSTPEPTTTTIPPLTAEKVAWLDGLTELKEELQKKDEIAAAATTGLTRPLMVLLGKTLASCGRELARLGAPPGDRLSPVHALAKEACQQLTRPRNVRPRWRVSVTPAAARQRSAAPGAAMEAGQRLRRRC